MGPAVPLRGAGALVALAVLATLLTPAEALRTRGGDTAGSSECSGSSEVQEAHFLRGLLHSLDGGGPPAKAPEEGAALYGVSHRERLLINPSPGTAANLALYPDKQGRITEVVNGTYSDRWSTMWSHYQEQLTQKLRKAQKGTSNSSPRRLQILIASPVSNALRSVDDFEFNMNRLKSNSVGDTFHFALFHYDGDDSFWKKRSWYNEAGGVVITDNRPMCKSAAWLKVEPKIARQYDYIWLMDGDLRMDFFSWDLYRGVLDLLDPLVSQPAIVPKGKGERSTDLEELQMVGAYGGTGGPARMFPVAREVERSESMAPLLSSKLWPVIYKRLMRNDVRTVWYMNTVWDILAQWGASSCGKTGVLVVNAAPVRHINCHDLLRRPNRTGNDCIRGCGHPDRQNCRPFSKRDKEYIQDTMKDICPLKTTESLIECTHIKHCREAVWKKNHVRQWMEETGSEAITPYLYRCNYTGVHVGFDAPCSLELA